MVESCPFAFHWTHGGTEVSLVGSFCGWKDSIPMEKEKNSHIFSVITSLPLGIHSYKFIVDGKWKYCPNQETITDQSGNVNNCTSIRPLHSNDMHQASPKKRVKKDRSLIHQNMKVKNRNEPLPNIHRRNSSIGNLATYATGQHSATGIKILLVMVGLPARGKSFVSRKLCRYMNWLGYKCKVFNLGSYRRERLKSFHSHDWFRADNPEGMKARNDMAQLALNDLLEWYANENGSVAIFDGTNSTVARRTLIMKRLKNERPHLVVKPIFVEIICTDEETINRNIRATKLSSPDYIGVDPEQVVKDFTERIEHYKKVYETLTREENAAFIKVLDVGRQIVGNKITGFIPGKIMFYLSNLHITPRPIYLSRHGQSEYNTENRIGGDSPLTTEGLHLATKLKEFIIREIPNSKEELCVWSSTMNRAVQTAEDIPCVQYIRWKTMEEIQVGICDGMSYTEIQEQMPDEFEARKNDKLRYRYPRGESYEDVIRRVEPVIIELERQHKPVLVVAHRAIIRCLYAYFADNMTREQVPFVSIPLNVVFKLQPGAYGTMEQRFRLQETQTLNSSTI